MNLRRRCVFFGSPQGEVLGLDFFALTVDFLRRRLPVRACPIRASLALVRLASHQIGNLDDQHPAAPALRHDRPLAVQPELPAQHDPSADLSPRPGAFVPLAEFDVVALHSLRALLRPQPPNLVLKLPNPPKQGAVVRFVRQTRIAERTIRSVAVNVDGSAGLLVALTASHRLHWRLPPKLRHAHAQK